MWAVGVAVCLASCRAYDANVLDERLRLATLDAYVGLIGTQFGGLEEAGVSVEVLRARYRDQALAAARPEEFYGVLRRMLADLDDPHASLKVPKAFWEGPVARPEGVQPMRAGEELWLAVPSELVRTREELGEDLKDWLDGIEGAVADGEAAASATLLVRSATSRAATDLPVRWMKLESVGGVRVESPYDAMLLLVGGLGTVVEVAGTLGGAPMTLALFRNAGAFELADDAGPSALLGPRKLARLLDPDIELPRRRHSMSIHTDLNRAQLELDGLFSAGWPLRGVPGELRREYGVKARVLFSPAGRRVSYLRIGDFQRDEDQEPWPSSDPMEPVDGPLVGLGPLLSELSDNEDWIIDLTGNPGGSWRDAGALLSYFMPEEMTVVPHEVLMRRRSVSWWGFPRTEVTSVRQMRRSVVSVLPRNILVLVDQGTASAGEITASALRSIAGARLVGERTAGAEYSTADFQGPDGSILTIGLDGGMLAPCEGFQGRGLQPDVRVELVGPEQTDGSPRARRKQFQLEALRAGLAAVDAADLLRDLEP